MLLVDAIPASMGSPARRVAPALAPGEQRRIVSTICPQRRGVFAIGPLTVIAVDPLGLVRLRRSFRGTDTVLVTPQVVPLTAGSPHAEHLGRGDATLAALAARGDDDVVPREYRIGDDLRRVHWRASARTGQMMVRREEQPWTRQAVIIVDDRRSSHVGHGPFASFENSLSAAASIGSHLLRAGFDIVVVGTDGYPMTPRLSGGDAQTLLLDSLAVVETRATPEGPGLPDDAEGRGVPGPWDPSTPMWNSDFVVSIITATEDAEGRLAVRHPRRSGDLGIVLVVDPADWTGSDSLLPAVLAAARAGRWHAAPLPRFTSASRELLAEAWARCLGEVTTDAAAGRR